MITMRVTERSLPLVARAFPDHGTRQAGLYSGAVPLYAAYGSNMDPAQMKERAPHSPMAGTGWLQGWRPTFGGADLAWEGALCTGGPGPGGRCLAVAVGAAG